MQNRIPCLFFSKGKGNGLIWKKGETKFFLDFFFIRTLLLITSVYRVRIMLNSFNFQMQSRTTRKLYSSPTFTFNWRKMEKNGRSKDLFLLFQDFVVLVFYYAKEPQKCDSLVTAFLPLTRTARFVCKRTTKKFSCTHISK